MSSSGIVVVEQHRETWSSRTAFLLAAVGAAVGFGNVWRFPALAYEYGGGAFFVPYLLALIFIGIPLLVQEIAMGQHLRKGDVGVSGSISPHLRGVGLASVFCGFMVVCYYVPLIAWCFRALFESFGRMRDDWEDISGQEASTYFFHNVVGTATLDEDLRPSRILPANVVYLAFTWAVVGSCLLFGIKWTGRIAYVTMGLPIAMLFILLIRAITLPGASDGIYEYVGKWDLAILFERPEIWSTAASQIFFSIGVAFGVMTTFGSHCDRNAPAFENALVIAGANSMFSIISGLCVFAILGYLATIEGDFRVNAGPALLFGAYPAALSTIPGGIHWVRFLFLNLILLGLDSAFALVEAAVAVLEDSSFSVPRKQKLVVIICTAGFFCGLLYTTDAALAFLDVVDFYVNFIILFLGFCKSISAGWLYGVTEQMDKLNYSLVYSYAVTTFGSLLFASMIWFGMEGNTFVLGACCYVVLYGAGISYCWKMMNDMVNIAEGKTMQAMIDELLMGNILQLREELSSSVGHIPFAWAVVMKHVIPQVLLVLFFNLTFARTDHENWEFGNYGDYLTWPFQVLGVICVLLALGIVLIGLAYAPLLEGFMGDSTCIFSKDMEIVTAPVTDCYAEMSGLEAQHEVTKDRSESPVMVQATDGMEEGTRSDSPVIVMA